MNQNNKMLRDRNTTIALTQNLSSNEHKFTKKWNESS